MKIAVTGATGFIGQALVPELQQRGHAIVALSRRPDSARQAFRETVEICDWSAEHPNLPPCDAIVHLAGESVFGRWSNTKKDEILLSRRTGTRRIVEAIARMSAAPSLLLSASAIGFYGERGDETLTEDSTAGAGFLADVTQEWEQEANRAANLGLRVVYHRIGIVLDEGGGAFGMMDLPFRLGLGGRLGNGQQWMSWIHRDDLVGLFCHALENSEIHGPLNVTAPNPVRNTEFTQTLAHLLHRPAILPVPEFALRLAFGEFGSALLSSQRVLPEKAQSSGFTFRFPTLDAALGDILASDPKK